MNGHETIKMPKNVKLMYTEIFQIFPVSILFSAPSSVSETKIKT